jgi:hypothetical protein
MLALQVVICFVALLASAVVLIALCSGRHQPTWAAVLLVSTALISLTGFVLPSPPGTPLGSPSAQSALVIALPERHTPGAQDVVCSDRVEVEVGQ